ARAREPALGPEAPAEPRGAARRSPHHRVRLPAAIREHLLPRAPSRRRGGRRPVVAAHPARRPPAAPSPHLLQPRAGDASAFGALAWRPARLAWPARAGLGRAGPDLHRGRAPGGARVAP